MLIDRKVEKGKSKSKVENKKDKKSSEEKGIIYAINDKTTPHKVRYKIQENQYQFDGTIYLPKKLFEGRKIPATLKMKMELQN